MSTPATAARPARDRPDWRDQAACRDADPELFFPGGDTRSARAQVKTAKLICRGCPVSATCLSWALASGQEAGIWGGLTEDQRRGLHRRGRPGGITPFPSGPATDLSGRSRRLSVSSSTEVRWIGKTAPSEFSCRRLHINYLTQHTDCLTKGEVTMHPLQTGMIARERPRDMLARADRQHLARSAAATRSRRGPARSLEPIVRQLIRGRSRRWR